LEYTILDGLRTLKLDLILSLALASLFLLIGNSISSRVAFLARSSIPAPALGGLLFAFITFFLHRNGTLGVLLDTSLRAPLQTVFFTTIGLSATLSLLRAGGWRMGLFWAIATIAAVVQNIVGVGLAVAMQAPPGLGIICGALTLTGGPATGLAFTERFEALGIEGAGSLIIAAATFGIFTASLVGNPVAAALIRRRKLLSDAGSESNKKGEEHFWAVGPTEESLSQADAVANTPLDADIRRDLSGRALLRALITIFLVMGPGALLGLIIARSGGILPGYVGAMIVAAVVRNLDDRYGWFGINGRAIEAIGVVALSFFLVIALMDLKLWQLAGLAVPMLAILLVQVAVMIAYAVLITFQLMGRDYEAAVTSSGHIGFGLGTTANAVANMEALEKSFGRAPRSFLIVPVVGGFFIDLTNTIVITIFINFVR
jgi:ESS family glutamate:Na+ symporter